MNKLGLVFALIFGLSIIGCTSTEGSQKKNDIIVNDDDQNKEKKGTENTIHPEYLTYETFLEKVWNFEENPDDWVFEGETAAVIDFYADWCKPCKMVAPIMDDLAVEYDGKVKIYKIDTDKEKKLASVFRIRSIPSVLFIPKEGQPMMQTGALPKEKYQEIINTELLKENK